MPRSGPYRAALFDLDGTISDSRPGIVAGMTAALAAIGIEVADDHDWAPYLGPPLGQIFTTQHDMTPEQLDVAVTAYLERYEGGAMFDAVVYPGMADLLAGLAGNGMVVAVATSKRAYIAEAVLDHFGLRDGFAHIGGSRPDGSGGAKAEVIAGVLAALDLDAGRDIVMVGDRHHDIYGGTSLGLATIGVAWGYAEPGELEASGADHIAASPADLAALLAP